MRALWAATRFLTRLPVPRTRDVGAHDLAASAVWFPAVGAFTGLLVAVVQHALTGVDAWIGALGAVLAWLWITGALHVDGAADLADALGARHRHPERFIEVLRDPRVGTFGMLAVLCIVLAKLIALRALATQPSVSAILILLPAWTRFGAVLWAVALPPLTIGYGELFGGKKKYVVLACWTAALLGVTLACAPIALIAAVALACWWAFLKLRVGGMNGDTLGAGIEWCEAGTLLLIAIATKWVTATDRFDAGIAASWRGI